MIELEKQQFVPFLKLIPNIITILSLCFGCLALKLALLESFEKAVLCIIVAAILDTLDGRFARLLNVKIKSKFFVGMPIPATGTLCLLPIILTFEEFNFPEFLILPYMICLGAMMISTIPTLSLKKLQFQKKYLALFMIICIITIALFFVEGWKTFLFLQLCYVLSIPFTVRRYIQLKNSYEKNSSHSS